MSSPVQLDESQLIQEVLEGNHQAFELLCAPYQGKLLQRARQITGCMEDAKDIVQDSLLKSFRALRSFRGECKFETWLTRIVINEARMVLRSPGRRRCVQLSMDAAMVHVAVSPDAHDRLSKAERLASLSRGIAHLPEPYREVIQLRLNDFNSQQCREHLAISLPALKSRQFRAIRLLRTHLQQQASL